MSKKILLAAVVAAFSATSALAGGLLTNTNQNAAYVRQMSQDGIIDITGLYANPAGTAFLSNGWHLSLNSQTAKQRRIIDTTFPLYALNVNNHATTHHFEGKAFAPVVPSFSLSYNKDKWSVNAHFGLIGGGGKCEFDEGLGSFEALYAAQLATNKSGIEALANAGVGAVLAAQNPALAGISPEYAYTGYSMNAYMKGRSYTFALQLGGTYKFMDNLAGYVGLRMEYANNNYNGYVQNVKAHLAAQNSIIAGIPTVATYEADPKSDLALNADQAGFGAAPVLGLDYKMNDQWNFAVRYEAPTVLNLKNKSEMNDMAKAQSADSSSPLAQFADGAKVRQDIPGLLSLGVMYSPLKDVRFMAGFHEFFDKSAKAYGNKQKKIDNNTWELNFGVEYDVCKLITLSASYQKTQYGQSDAYMDDLSFNLSNQMVGGGLRINATKRCAIDLGYMYTFYKDRTVSDKTTGKTDKYARKNYTYGLGVNLAF